MNRTSLNFIIDIIAFIFFVSLTTTGILMYYILPPGSGEYLTIWGLDRHEWGDIHFWMALVLLTILTIHLFLHAKWIFCVVRGKPHKTDRGSRTRIALGLLGVIALLFIASSPLLSPVLISTHEGQGSHDIRGSMTLGELETYTGIPKEEILTKLGLPQDIPRKEHLGRLRRQYGIDIGTIRKLFKR